MAGIKGSPLRNNVNIDIKKSRDVDGDTFYVIEVDSITLGRKHMVQRRYSDFVKLVEQLQPKHMDRVLPALPRKHLFTSKTDKVISERIVGLESFLRQISFVRKIFEDPLIKSFLAIEDSSDDLEERLSSLERASENLNKGFSSPASTGGGRERSLSSAEKIKQHRSGVE